jgi:hypothetical protein
VASIEDKTARTESVVLAHKKTALATIVFSAIGDAIKDHYQEKLTEWAIKYLGVPLGTWLVRNPTSIITISSALLVIWFMALFIKSPKRSYILQHDETPFVNTKSRRMLLLSGCVVVLLVIFSGAYAYAHRQNRVTQRPPSAPTNVSATFSAESSMTMTLDERGIVPMSDAESVCANGSKTGHGLKGIESLPGGPSLHKPGLIIDGHRVRIQWSSLDPEHIETLFEIEVTNRGESSIAKDWRLCLSQAGKAVYFDAQDLKPENGIKTSVADVTLQSPIEHGRTVKGWLLFVLPKDQDLQKFTGSIQCRDYLDKRSLLVFTSE